MTNENYADFVDAVASIDLGEDDVRATAHTSAVFAGNWDRVESALAADRDEPVADRE